MQSAPAEQQGFFEAMIGDGRPLLKFTGLMLVLSGVFALFLSATGHFLPHDVQYLGMTAKELCNLHQCKIVHFMFHDRASFGGTLIAIGSLYMWLAEFPLRGGEPWAWWVFLLSGTLGFASFFVYLGYGYLDTWHGTATLFLLPLFAFGMYRSFSVIQGPCGFRCLIQPSVATRWTSSFGIGRACLLITAVALVCGGTVIMLVGMTSVFVPQDLQFMGLSAADLQAINPHLVPLIAHDRGWLRRWLVQHRNCRLLLHLVRDAESKLVAGAVRDGHRWIRHRNRRTPDYWLHELHPSSPGGHGCSRLFVRAGTFLQTNERRPQNQSVKRRLITFFSAVSLVLCVGTCVLWVRSLSGAINV